MLSVALLLVGWFAGFDAGNPVATAARAIGKSGLTAAEAPAKSPTAFRPSGSRSFVTTFASGVSDKADERKAIAEGLIAFIESYEEAAKQGKFENDAAGALAFSVSFLYGAAKGTEVSDATMTTLIGQLKKALDINEVRQATDAQKQEFYEHALCTAGLVLILASGAETDAQKTQIRSLAASNLELLTGAKLDQFELKESTLRIKGSTPAAPAGGLAAGFSFTPPAGWQKSGNWWIKSKIENRGGGDEVRSAMIMFLPAVTAQGNMGDALRSAWNQSMPKGLEGRAGGMVYRRYVGDGLFSQFIFGGGREEGRRSDTMYSLFMVDCGKQWQPVIVALTYEDRGLLKTGGEAMMGSLSFSESWPMAEEALAALRGPGPKYVPIVAADALAGNYHFGSGANLQWENIYTGATTLTFVSYGGELNLAANATFTYRFVSASGQVGASQIRNARGSGTYRIERDLLICTFKEYDQGDGYKAKEQRYRIAGLVQFGTGEKVAVLMSQANVVPSCITLGDSSHWYTTKKK